MVGQSPRQCPRRGEDRAHQQVWVTESTKGTRAESGPQPELMQAGQVRAGESPQEGLGLQAGVSHTVTQAPVITWWLMYKNMAIVYKLANNTPFSNSLYFHLLVSCNECANL